jgi:hypothetical protein
MGASPRAVVALGDQRREGKSRMGKNPTALVRRVSVAARRVLGVARIVANGELRVGAGRTAALRADRWEMKAGSDREDVRVEASGEGLIVRQGAQLLNWRI